MTNKNSGQVTTEELHPSLKAGSTAVVTGGADGIGLAAAKHFLQLGMNVCIADIDQAKLNSASEILRKETKSSDNNLLAYPVNVSSYEEMEKLCEAVYNRFNTVDVLMNNAARTMKSSAIKSSQSLHKTLAVNLFGVTNGF